MLAVIVLNDLLLVAENKEATHVAGKSRLADKAAKQVAEDGRC